MNVAVIQSAGGADGSITGLKTPKVEKPDDGDAVLLEKLYLLGQLMGVIREVAKG